MWKDRTRKPEPQLKTCCEIECEGISLNISEDANPDNGYWQHFMLSFGEFSYGIGLNDCRMNWAKEAIAEARRRLDGLESQLNKEQTK